MGFLVPTHTRNAAAPRAVPDCLVTPAPAVPSPPVRHVGDLPWHLQCLASGIGAVTSYKVLARYNDLRQLRYDDSLFFVSPFLIELLCTTRKNNQEFSTRLAAARPADPNEFGVYNALILG